LAASKAILRVAYTDGSPGGVGVVNWSSAPCSGMLADGQATRGASRPAQLSYYDGLLFLLMEGSLLPQDAPVVDEGSMLQGTYSRTVQP
jgi:hypothetical protein